MRLFIFNFTEYVSRKHPLGGMLFLLPEIFRLENGGGGKDVREKEVVKNVLLELEKLLVHAKLPVSLYSDVLLSFLFHC